MAGPQPAIVEVTSGKHAVSFFDALIVLPQGVPFAEPIGHPVYSAAMKVTTSDYRPLMSRARKNALIGELTLRRWDTPPFTPLVQGQACEHVYSLLRKAHAETIPSVPETLDEIVNRLKARACWTPQHFSERVSMKLSADHWRILTNWAEWERRGWDWMKRYAEFEKDYPTLTPDEKAAGKERLRKACASIGLANITSRVAPLNPFARNRRG